MILTRPKKFTIPDSTTAAFSGMSTASVSRASSSQKLGGGEENGVTSTLKAGLPGLFFENLGEFG